MALSHPITPCPQALNVDTRHSPAFDWHPAGATRPRSQRPSANLAAHTRGLPAGIWAATRMSWDTCGRRSRCTATAATLALEAKTSIISGNAASLRLLSRSARQLSHVTRDLQRDRGRRTQATLRRNIGNVYGYKGLGSYRSEPMQPTGRITMLQIVRKRRRRYHEFGIASRGPEPEPTSVDRLWGRLRSLFVPSVSVAAILNTIYASSPDDAVERLYNWERDRLLSLAKGAAAAAVTVLTSLIASAVEGKVTASPAVIYLAAALVGVLLAWGAFILTGLRRLAEEYALALEVINSDRSE